MILKLNSDNEMNNGLEEIKKKKDNYEKKKVRTYSESLVIYLEKKIERFKIHMQALRKLIEEKYAPINQIEKNTNEMKNWLKDLKIEDLKKIINEQKNVMKSEEKKNETLAQKVFKLEATLNQA